MIGFKEVEEAPISRHIGRQVDEIRADIRRLSEALDSIRDTLSVTFEDGEELNPDPWSIDWEDEEEGGT